MIYHDISTRNPKWIYYIINLNLANKPREPPATFWCSRLLPTILRGSPPKPPGPGWVAPWRNSLRSAPVRASYSPLPHSSPAWTADWPKSEIGKCLGLWDPSPPGQRKMRESKRVDVDHPWIMDGSMDQWINVQRKNGAWKPHILMAKTHGNRQLSLQPIYWLLEFGEIPPSLGTPRRIDPILNIPEDLLGKGLQYQA